MYILVLFVLCVTATEWKTSLVSVIRAYILDTFGSHRLEVWQDRSCRHTFEQSRALAIIIWA